jgi:hypothetical protein
MRIPVTRSRTRTPRRRQRFKFDYDYAWADDSSSNILACGGGGFHPYRSLSIPDVPSVNSHLRLFRKVPQMRALSYASAITAHPSCLFHQTRVLLSRHPPMIDRRTLLQSPSHHLSPRHHIPACRYRCWHRQRHRCQWTIPVTLLRT